MQNCYVDQKHNAIADLINYEDGKLITRINVPREHRGQAIGSKLLQEITDAADRENVTLYAWASSSDGLSTADLKEWHRRHGFITQQEPRGLTRRPPRAKTPTT